MTRMKYPVRVSAQAQVRAGFPVERIPDPVTAPVKKKTAYGRHLGRYMLLNEACGSRVRRKSAKPRLKRFGALVVLHATKGWRIF